MPHLVARIRGNLRSILITSSVLTLSCSALTVAPDVAQAASTPCSAMSKPVFERVNPTSQSGILTLDQAQAQSASTSTGGFTSVRDTSMLMASAGGAGLAGVHRLYLAATGNYLYTVDPVEAARAVTNLGYVDQGVVFYAARSAASCLTPVYSYYKAGHHRFVVSVADRAALKAAGWRKEGVRFYARKPTLDPTFSIVVMPDTQQEVLKAGDERFVNRSNWLVANRAKLDLRFVSHTGDVVNWDTADHSQYAVARDALAPLNAAGIPYSLSIGNHDTQATGVGGGARDAVQTHALQRDTSVFNRYLGRQDTDLEGAYEPGKVDNTFHVFTAGGQGWLVLNLELWPRKGVVDWAEDVVKLHPRHNVIVVTHSYLNANGSIYTGIGGYGDTSPKYLYDHLVRKYANVRMVFSGHVGQAAHRVDTGIHGNRIDSFLTAMHSNTTNPMRLVAINTKTGTVTTRVYAPWTDHTFSSYSLKLTHRHWAG